MKNPKFYWIFSGNRERASSRIHGFNFHDEIKKRGISSKVLFHPKTSTRDLPSGFNAGLGPLNFLKSERKVFIIQKTYGKNTQVYMKKLARMKNTEIVYMDSDMPLKTEEVLLANRILVPSKYLQTLYLDYGFKSVFQFKDPVEYSIFPISKENEILKGLWFGNPGKSKWESFVKLRNFVNREFGSQVILESLSYNEEADHKWNGIKSFEIAKGFDFAVVPMFYKGDQEFSKSSNRVIQAMALGLPVLASPIPSYVQVIDQGKNGYICSNLSEYICAINKILDSQLRRAMSIEAFKFSTSHFSITSAVDDFLEIFGL